MDREQVIKAFSGDPYSARGTTVECPVCGFQYSHIREVYTRMGGDEYEAKVYQGTEVKEQGAERRSALVIVVDGECEHAWKLIIKQLKGVNVVDFEMCENECWKRIEAQNEMSEEQARQERVTRKPQRTKA